MNIIQQILNILLKIFGQGTQASIPQAPKVPPAMNPEQYRQWLRAEVDKKGQPPQGYEAQGQPGTSGRKTFCNFFVRSVCKTFGWNGFESQATDQAGEMVDYMELHPESWQRLGGNYTEATEWACKGCLVIAGWKNPDYPKTTPTGHVCVVAPENQLIFSNKWNKPVSIGANVGASNWYGKSLSWAFQAEPTLYLYLGA